MQTTVTKRVSACGLENCGVPLAVSGQLQSNSGAVRLDDHWKIARSSFEGMTGSAAENVAVAAGCVTQLREYMLHNPTR